MAIQTWVSNLVAQKEAGTSFGTYTTAKTVVPATSLKTLYANELYVGKMYEIDILGGIGTLVTTPGTITFQVKFGSVVAFTSGAIQLNATAHTNLPFWLKIFLTCRTIGNSTTATMMGQAIAHGMMFTNTAGQTDDANSMAMLMAPATAPAVGTGFDSTTDNIVDFFAGFSISDAANTIKVEQHSMKALN